MDERRGVYRVLVGELEGKRSLGRPRRRWDDNIKMNIQKVERGGMDWINLAQDKDGWRAVVNAVMIFRVTLSAGNFLTDLKLACCSRRILFHRVGK